MLLYVQYFAFDSAVVKTQTLINFEQLKYTFKKDKVSKGAKIRNRYNQVPHPTQDTNGKVTNSQLDTTNESQELSLFPAGDHKAQINRRTQRHSKHKTEKNKTDAQKKYRLGKVSKIFYWMALTSFTAPTSPLILVWTRTQTWPFTIVILTLVHDISY